MQKKDYLIEQFIKLYSTSRYEFFPEAVEMKLVQIRRMTRGKYANYGLVITGREKFLRYFFLKKDYSFLLRTAMWRYSIPEVIVKTNNGKVLRTEDVTDTFYPSGYYFRDELTSLLTIISRIVDTVRNAGYLVDDTFSDSRSLNFDVFNVFIHRPRDRYEFFINVANTSLAAAISANLYTFRTSKPIKITIFVGGKKRIFFLTKDFHKEKTMSNNQSTSIEAFATSIPGLERATFPEFFQFLSEEAEKGRFWTLTDNLTDRCLFMTDPDDPKRLTAPIIQHIGYDFRYSWRDSLDEYDRLKHLLATEKTAPSFEYDLYRLDDSLAHYQKTYYLIEGLWGGQVRASVSEGWELLRPASTD